MRPASLAALRGFLNCLTELPQAWGRLACPPAPCDCLISYTNGHLRAPMGRTSFTMHEQEPRPCLSPACPVPTLLPSVLLQKPGPLRQHPLPRRDRCAGDLVMLIAGCSEGSRIRGSSPAFPYFLSWNPAQEELSRVRGAQTSVFRGLGLGPAAGPAGTGNGHFLLCSFFGYLRF